jgi:SAM-dependent methyltransferase
MKAERWNSGGHDNGRQSAPSVAEPEAGLDTYQGMSWTERASLGPLRAAIDPSDIPGRRNELIDSIQRRALRWAIAEARRLHPGALHMALDFGCGGGRLTDELATVAAETWATDRNPAMVELAKKHARIPSERVVLWSDDSDPFGGVRFDLMLTVMVTLTPTLLGVVTSAMQQLVAEDGIVVMIEQLDGNRNLTIGDYRRELAAKGFSIRSQRLVRRGTRSPFLAIASRLKLPASAVELLGRMEWALAPMLGIARGGYADSVIVSSRISSKPG